MIKKAAYLIFSLICLSFLLEMLKKINLSVFLNFSNLPTIQDIFQYTVKQIGNTDFYYNISHSIVRILSGFLISVSLSIPLAFLTFQTKFVRNFIYPILELLRPVPNAAWIPISILIFTSINSSVIFIIAISSFFPIFVNTLRGLEHIHINYIKTSKFLGVTKVSYLFEVLLPAALPNIFTGLSLGISGAWLGLVMAEMISGHNGIGYMIWVSYTLIDFSGVIFGTIVIGSLGALSSLLLKLLSKRLLRWKKNYS